jgi:peptidoglycan/xylan/chitin deacetylase (PgdA/CDA1 family)
VTDVLVLGYHAISERWPADLSTTPERFEQQVRLLLRRRYRPATFSQAVGAPGSGRTFAVTFDDAYRSVIDLALPLLTRLGVPGTVFTPTSFVGSDEPMAWPGIDQWLGGPYENELRCMSWDQLAQLQGAGWEIGSHTHTHPRLPALSDSALADELTRSRELCAERLGEPCRSLAYPYGDHDARVVAAAGRAGYEAAATLPARLHRPEPLRWPRVGVYHADGPRRFQAKVSPVIRRIRESRAWDLADAVRDHGRGAPAG